MGTYLNPGNGGFRESLKSKIYVDKTGLIDYTNDVLSSEQKYICVSRPRRFGKSMAANMLAAYYDRNCNSHALFDGLEIAKNPSYEIHLNKYNVLYFSVNDFISKRKDVPGVLSLLNDVIAEDLEEEYSGMTFSEKSIDFMLKKIFAKTRVPFVIIIDEWDCVFREREDDTAGQKIYLDFLRDLLKDKEYVALAYMTGILPVRKYGESAVNMFDEFSMTNAGPLAQYTGFTEEEVMSLCKRYGRPYQEMKEWYDGYDVNGTAIYNPRSVIESVLSGTFDNYWTQTGSYESLEVYINMNAFGVRDRIARLIAGEEMEADVTGFQSDMVSFKSADDVMTLLVHLGYLTYDRERGTVRIPNREVRDRFTDTVKKNGLGRRCLVSQ